MQRGLRICVFGAGPDTGNLGVTALGLATVRGVLRRRPDAHVTLFDHGEGRRIEGVMIDDRPHAVHRMGAVNSKRLYRGDNFWHIRVCGRMGGWAKNDVIAEIRAADVVLDVSGGDSFTDMYGPTRFRSMTLPKVIVLEQGVPLVLLPQTIGPFTTTTARSRASQILLRSRAVWSRDAAGIETLQSLLGSKFDPSKHRQGVDLAFGMDAQPACEQEILPLARWMHQPKEQRLAVNVSGLLFNDAKRASVEYGLKADYREAIRTIVAKLLKRSEGYALLVPHVHTDGDVGESDDAACAALMKSFEGKHSERLIMLPRSFNARQVKWVISQAEWFVGSRMHSTIAALSSGVPCAAIAYSDKTSGVFASCGMERAVCDPRRYGTEEIVDATMREYERRESVRSKLQKSLVTVLERCQQQMDDILQLCESLADASSSRERLAA